MTKAEMTLADFANRASNILYGYGEASEKDMLHRMEQLVEMERNVQSVGGVLIAKERHRQIEEGYTLKHDCNHRRGELAIAAACYALHHTSASVNYRGSTEDTGWPWNGDTWKPKDIISNLSRAGAFIAAEIDRILWLMGTNVKLPDSLKDPYEVMRQHPEVFGYQCVDCNSWTRDPRRDGYGNTVCERCMAKRMEKAYD